MAVITPGGSIVITPAEDLLFRAMDEEPLQTARTNANWLYLYHNPRMACAAPNQPSALARNSVIVVPCTPSADGLRYDFRTIVRTSNNTNINVTCEYTLSYTGLAASGTPTAWVNIFTQATATTAGARTIQLKAAQTVPATAVALRFTTWADAGTYEIHMHLVTPGQTAIGSGIKDSGFVPADDGLFGTITGSPVNTEHLNRCRQSATAVLIDRKQMVLSMTHDEVQANCRNSETNLQSYQNFAPVRIRFPNQGETTTVKFKSLATVTGGAALADAIRVSQVGGIGIIGKNVTLDATVAGAIDSADLELTLEGDALGRYADIQVAIKTPSAQTTYLHSLVGIWSPEA